MGSAFAYNPCLPLKVLASQQRPLFGCYPARTQTFAIQGRPWRYAIGGSQQLAGIHI